MLNRRGLLAGAGLIGLAGSRKALAAMTGSGTAPMQGEMNAADLGVRPGSDDQSDAFARMLERASEQDSAVFLPPGIYTISNLSLPRRVRLIGVPGATRIVYGGGGHLLIAEEAEHIELSCLVIDGANRRIGEQAHGLLDLRRIEHLAIDDCEIVGSAKNGLALERASGRVEGCSISGAADAGLYSVEAGRLRITGNSIANCGNGGILVHRWQAAGDGTMITGNRIERIAARNGGTGQFGNGINVFRADNVIVANNSVSGCDFSAIRANSASNIQITGNSCLKSGETGIYAEFSFEGAVISANVVAGAANGISIVNFDQGGRMAVCSGNIVRSLSQTGPYPADAPGFGIGISVEADTAVTGNVVEDAPLYGMKIGWGPFMRNVSATGNVLRETGTGIAVSVVEGTGSAVISDNVIDTAARGAIIGYRWSEAVTGDLALAGSSGFAGLTIEHNQVS